MLINNIKRPHICCYMIPDRAWYINENTLLAKHSNIEQIIVDGIENYLFITSLLIFSRFMIVPNNQIINKLTDPMINLSKKIMNFNNFPLQIAFSMSTITLLMGIDSVLGIEKKKNINKKDEYNKKIYKKNI